MTHAKSMTIPRQIVAALSVSVLVTLAVIAIALLFLGRVSDARQRLVDIDARQVIDAYGLELSVAERGVALRNLLITGDEEYRTRLEDAETAYQEALGRLQLNVADDDGRALLDAVRVHKAALDEVTDSAVSTRLEGEIGADDLSELLAQQLTPARRALTGAISSFVDHQEQRIEQAGESADRLVSDTVWLLVILGLAGAGLAVLIGGWIARNVSRNLTGMALSIDAAAAEILAGTAQQAAGASEQAAAVQQTVATADELAQTSEQSAERARSVADDAQQSAEVAEDGAAAVDESAAAMADIQQQVDAIAATVVSLAERAQDISGIVDTIEDLAGETHLLALNAAIEAARAGEHGRGFSVVANEVRSLADESKRSTSRIAGILAEIRQSTDTAVMATEQGGKSVAEGVQTVERTGGTIRQLADSVASSAIAAEQISASSGQQAVATAQINTAMRDIGDSAQQNAAAARQAEQAARDLNEVATKLKGLVGAE